MVKPPCTILFLNIQTIHAIITFQSKNSKFYQTLYFFFDVTGTGVYENFDFLFIANKIVIFLNNPFCHNFILFQDLLWIQGYSFRRVRKSCLHTIGWWRQLLHFFRQNPMCSVSFFVFLAEPSAKADFITNNYANNFCGWIEDDITKGTVPKKHWFKKIVPSLL